MNKRSAMMVAAGLVFALMVAGAAVATGFTGPEAAASDSGVATSKLERPEPKVRTITETVTVHRDAKPSGSAAAAPVVITQSPSSPASPVDSSDSSTYDDDGYDDDGYDDDGYEDDGYDDEDHEDDDEHEGEDD